MLNKKFYFLQILVFLVVLVIVGYNFLTLIEDVSTPIYVGLNVLLIILCFVQIVANPFRRVNKLEEVRKKVLEVYQAKAYSVPDQLSTYQLLHTYLEDQQNLLDYAVHEIENIQRPKPNLKKISFFKEPILRTLSDLKIGLYSEREANKSRQWHNEGVAYFAEYSQTLKESLNRYAENMLREILRYLEAEVGAIYVVRQEFGEVEVEMLSSFAYDRRIYQFHKTDLDDTLVGQAIKEKDILYESDMKEEYLTIASGIGQTKPKTHVVAPLIIDNQPMGAIEIASLSHFQEHHINLIRQIGQIMASDIRKFNTDTQLKRMMSTIREQNSEMRSTEEELRQNVEELTATRESLQNKNLQFEETVRDLEKARATLSLQQKTLRKLLNELPLNIYLKDSDGRYVVVNEGVASKHNISPEEMFGKSDFDLYTYDEAKGFRDQDLSVIQQGELETVESELVHGVSKTYSTRKKVFYIDFLREYGLLAYQTDLTSKHKVTDQASEAV